MSVAAFPKKAKVVIIGLGGIVGASVAHHLVERGWDDIVGIDKSGIPTDIGSTAHASDFCYTTSHDFLSCWTTLYSIDFYEKMGHYARIGGIEVARVGDDERMEEIRRKVSSGKAFGTRARLMEPAEIKEKFPLDRGEHGAGRPVGPGCRPRRSRARRRSPASWSTRRRSAGKLKSFANTPATSLVIENGRITGVVTDRGTIMADHVVVCAGLWGRLIAEMAGEDLPVMPIDHPLTFFGPYNEFAGTGKEIGWPLLRDQGNSAYMRDTGDPDDGRGRHDRVGLLRGDTIRACAIRASCSERHEARLSPSQRDLDMEQILAPLERAIELTPILGELGYDERRSFNGLLQVTADGGAVDGREPEGARPVVLRRRLGQGRPRHGQADRRLDDGRPHRDRPRHASTIARFYPHQLDEEFIAGRCGEAAQKVYNPGDPSARALSRPAATSAARPSTSARRSSAATSWSSAAGSARTATPPTSICWRNTATAFRCARTNGTTAISGASPMPSISRMSEDCGIINLSHFAMFDVEGPDHVALMEWVCAAKIGGDANIGKGIYTHFLDDEGMVRADLTVFRMADRCRVVDGADAGPRDFHYLRRVAEDKGFDVTVTDVTEKYVTIGIWGPNARDDAAEGGGRPGRPVAGELPLRRDQADRDRRQDRQRLPHLLCRRAGLGTAHGLRGRPRRLGCAALDRRHGGRHRDLCQQPPHGEEPAPAERRPPDRVQPARSRSRAPEGQGGRFPRQGQASGIPRPRRTSPPCCARW